MAYSFNFSYNPTFILIVNFFIKFGGLLGANIHQLKTKPKKYI